jgi:hypothetical protein
VVIVERGSPAAAFLVVAPTPGPFGSRLSISSRRNAMIVILSAAKDLDL